MALVVVLIIVLLGLITVSGAFRVAAMSESLTGGSADQARTLAAAEALLRDAEIDIRGRLPNLTSTGDPYRVHAPPAGDGLLGLPCRTVAPPAGKVIAGCRLVDDVPGATTDTAWVPRSLDEYHALSAVVATVDPVRRCLQGICMPTSLVALAQLHEQPVLGEVFPRGAAYGQFTGTTPSATQSNPSLNRNTAATALPADGQPWGRYWIEVFRHAGNTANGASPTSALVPDPTSPFVYRITAVAQGLRPGSRVILRQTFVPNPAAQNP